MCIDNLSTQPNVLRAAFERFGQVANATVIGLGGLTKGFIDFATAGGHQAALRQRSLI
jgi:hypothetical protein